MSGLIRLFLILAISLMLHACGGGDAETPWDTTTDTGGTGTDTGDTGDTGTGGDPNSPASISFVSANPSQIGIKGFGLTEVSTITFKLVDDNALAIQGLTVNFTLSTTAGGITLSPTSGTTDVNGNVTVEVTSGTVATVATVRATLASDTSIWARSDNLIVSTGIADQNSMTVGAETINVSQAIDVNGIIVPVSVYAADHFNNPVPDGTAVSFTTEGGQIGSGCFTVDGGCTVNWISSNPRPSDGRITILATMVGEESFLDGNGNGVLDGGDPNPLTTLGYDMDEAFVDVDEDGVFDNGEEEFVDFNTNATYDFADGEFNGILCCDSAAVAAATTAGEGLCFGVTPTTFSCSDAKNISVRGYGLIVMSGYDAFFNYSTTALDASGGSATVTVTVFDLNGNPMPKDTTIDIAVSNGVLASSDSYTVRNTGSPTSFNVTVDSDGTSSTGGRLTITVTTPTGDETTSSAVTIAD